MGLDKRTLLMVASGSMALNTLFVILSNALPSWCSSGDSSLSLTVGLWKECIVSGYRSYCVNVGCSSLSSSQCAEMMIGRGFLTVACIVSALSTSFLLWSLKQGENIEASHLRWTKWLPFSVFFMTTVGVSVGIAYAVSYDDVSLDAAAILGIITIIINLVGAIMTNKIPL